MYVIRAADSAITEMMRALGFRQLAPAIEIDGVFHDPCVLDFGPGSVDAWLARLIEAETSAPTADSDACSTDDRCTRCGTAIIARRPAQPP